MPQTCVVSYQGSQLRSGWLLQLDCQLCTGSSKVLAVLAAVVGPVTLSCPCACLGCPCMPRMSERERRAEALPAPAPALHPRNSGVCNRPAISSLRSFREQPLESACACVVRTVLKHFQRIECKFNILCVATLEPRLYQIQSSSAAHQRGCQVQGIAAAHTKFDKKVFLRGHSELWSLILDYTAAHV